ncbi:MAG: hypothetical protein JWP81_494 [Ferruginibacter sp.]|nr:hypothetical protein [Ferruginibacter sp.]
MRLHSIIFKRIQPALPSQQICAEKARKCFSCKFIHFFQSFYLHQVLVVFLQVDFDKCCLYPGVLVIRSSINQEFSIIPYTSMVIEDDILSIKKNYQAGHTTKAGTHLFTSSLL